MKKMISFFLLLTVLSATSVSAVEISVNFAAECGPVKPVNGVGQPPMPGGPGNFMMFHYLREAGIPYSRLHDVGIAAELIALRNGPCDLVNDSDTAIPLAFDFGERAVASVRLTDADRTDAVVALPAVLPPRAFAVVLLRKEMTK